MVGFGPDGSPFHCLRVGVHSLVPCAQRLFLGTVCSGLLLVHTNPPAGPNSAAARRTPRLCRPPRRPRSRCSAPGRRTGRRRCSPGHDRAVGLQAQAVIRAAATATKPALGAGTALAPLFPRPRSSRRPSGPGCDTRPPRRPRSPRWARGRCTGRGVVSPGHDRAVGLEAQAVESARRDGHEAGVRRGHVALAVVVVSPGHDRAVGLQAQAVRRSPPATATKPAFGAGTLHWP